MIVISDCDSESLSKIATGTAANPPSTQSPTETIASPRSPAAYIPQIQWASPYPIQRPPARVVPVTFTLHQGTSTRSRFFKAFLMAGVMYIVAWLFIQSVVVVAKFWKIDLLTLGNVHPEPSDGHVIDCFNYKAPKDSRVDATEQILMFQPAELLQPAKWLQSVDLSFTIPSNSNVVFFLSRGSHSSGDITYVLSDVLSSGDKIEIDIKITYDTTWILANTQVCLLGRDGGGQGIGFFTPRTIYGRLPGVKDRVKFTATVRFPRLESGSQTVIINSLESKLDHWTQHVAPLGGHILFNKVSLRSVNSPITIDSISAISGSFETVNSPITGSFNVSDSLSVHTVNAPIDVQVSLENDPTAKTTSLDMKAVNAQIKAAVSLVSANATADEPASFSVSTETVNGPLTLTFPEAPSTRLSPFYILNLMGKTTNTPVSVTLHPTYEGSISLHGLLSSPKFSSGSSSDPSGEGRSRQLKLRTNIGNTFEADTWWGEPYATQKGTVTLSTVIGPIEVTLP